MPARPRVAVTLTQCWHRVPGGSATSVLRLLEAVGRHDDVDLVGVGPRGDLRRPASVLSGRPPGEPWTPTVPMASVPAPLPVLYDLWRLLGRPSIEAATGPVDLVHLTVPVVPPRTAAPVVATVHDLFPWSDPGRMSARGARLTGAGLDWIRAHARAVMVPSGTVAEQCAESGFDPRRLHVVPWGAEVRVPDDDRAVGVPRRFGLDGPYVLFVGTLEPRKNLPGLARAMALLGRSDLALVLAGPDGWGDGLEEELAGVPGPVHRLGLLREEDLAPLRRGAAVCAMPSLAEGFGLPVLEAMAAGGAVVTSAGTATAEVAGDAAVLVDPADPASIAQGIARLLDDPALASSLRARGIERAGRYSWDEAARLTVDVYRGVLA